LQLIAKGLLFLKRKGIIKTTKKVIIKIKQHILLNIRKLLIKYFSPRKITSLRTFLYEIIISGGTVFGKKIINKWCTENSDKNIFLISHELSLTGAPIALYYFAENLKEKGYHPIIISRNDGSLDGLVNESERLSGKIIPV